MASLRIRVGAALDANVLTVYQPLEKAAANARKKIEQELGIAASRAALAGAKGIGGAYREGGKVVGDAAAKAGAATKKMARTAGASVDEIKTKFAALKGAAANGLNLSAVAAQAERDLKKIESAAARAALGLKSVGGGGGSGGGAIGIGRRAGIRTSRAGALAYGLAGSAASFAGRVGRDVIGGLGVETDLGSLVSKGVAHQRTAQNIVNAGYMPDDPNASAANRELQDAGAITSEARNVSVGTGTSMDDTLGALSAFVGKTGDLETGRKSLFDMAQLARATGSNLTDVANAAAEVSNNLGDIPDKAKVTQNVMRAIAGQGKLGAVEMKDLASQMAKIASVANRFAGGSEKNIEMFGAIAQEAKARGGAPTATGAATSVQAFANTMVTPTTIKNWKAKGINPFTDSSQTTLANPMDLIKSALKATDTGKGSDLQALKQLFPSSAGYKAVAGFQQIYNEKGGGSEGMKAVDEEFRSLANATLTQSEVARAFAASMQTDEAKVAAFNVKLEQVAVSLAGTLLPALEAFGPTMILATQDLVEWMAKLTGNDKELRQSKIANIDRRLEKFSGVTPETLEATKKVINSEPRLNGMGGYDNLVEQRHIAQYDPKVKALLEEKQKLLAERATLTHQQYQTYNKGPDNGAMGVVIKGFLGAANVIPGLNEAVQNKYAGGDAATSARNHAAQENFVQSDAAKVGSDQIVQALAKVTSAIETGNAKMGEIGKNMPKAGKDGTMPPNASFEQ